VLTQTKGSVLKTLAESGRGSYYQVSFGGDAINRLHQDIARLQKTTFDSAEMTNYNERFQLFLFFGCVLALIELVIAERRVKTGAWRGRFEVGQ
jgi:Ca-activated chloride channel family protein